jgi:pectin methylesterase-like acyl-CoA thioesterase
MKRKLQLLIFTLLLSISFAQAQKTDVWDFGAAQLDVNTYNNQMDVTAINNWYTYNANVILGSANTTYNVLPSFTAGILKWVGGSNDRLRALNTSITRYDANLGGVGTSGCTGRIYVNATAAPTRYLELTLNADDEITIIEASDAVGMLNFEFMDTPGIQKNQVATTTTATQYKFVAKNSGKYRIYDSTSKPSYYRIYRKPATYANITGSIDVTQAPGMPSTYSVSFTNAAGKVFTAPVNAGSYAINLPAGYAYQLSLANANGFIISNGESLAVLETTTTYNISVLKVNLFTVSGPITGLGTDISKVSLIYTPDPSANKIFIPKPVINTSNSTYTVELEANTLYTISALGVNDYEILANTITITGATTSDITFTAKPVYPVTIIAPGLDATQFGNLKLTFTNLNESGYIYSFNTPTSISLRTGTYSIAYSGLENYQVEMSLVSNLKITGAATSKTLDFKPTTVWSFDDKIITTTTPAYKAMLFSGIAGTISNRIANGDLTAKTGGIIQVPVKVGEKITISYYFAANFSIDGGTPIITTSGSTSIIESVEYTYPGAINGYVTITLLGTALTSYFTEIKIGGSIPYSPVITVGVGKEFQTINTALEAVSKMVRTTNQRVTIMIDSGNYEEMIDVTQANVTLKNASTTPNITLANKGVAIDANAVRITSYYGVGYNYYSMKNNQKWDADVLRVNKENGFQPYVNQSGTTNNSYWNATLIVSANGFEANDIIIENSFNQYISKKESEDVLEMWTSGGKGIRPTTIGNTDVQNRSFVERAAAIAIKNNIDKVVLNKCRVIGRQDSFFGGTNARVVIYKGVMMGAVDYIFGGMNAVFYQTDFAMNTSDVSGDASYITAAQQASGRGYLMYECKVTTAIPGTETASVYRAKPGFFGRPWAANTSEVVFYNTAIETSNYPGNEGQSLISSVGWNNSLGGTSAKMYEYGTVENSGVNNTVSRASWSTSLTSPILTDGTAITTFNFTKGADNWDPIPQLITNDTLGIKNFQANSAVNVYAYTNNIVVSNVKSNTKVFVYSLTGSLVKSFETNSDTNFNLNGGVWIVLVKDADGQKSVKLMTF